MGLAISAPVYYYATMDKMVIQPRMNVNSEKKTFIQPRLDSQHAKM